MRVDNERLSRLGSMQELRAAKYQVNRNIRRLEHKFTGNYRAAKEQFSFKTAIMYGLEVVDTIQSIFRYTRNRRR